MDVCAAEDVFNTHEAVGADVRYDDDSCDGVAPAQQTWATVGVAHGSEVVSSIKVTTGLTGGNTLSALLRSIKLNGTEYVFGAAQTLSSTDGMEGPGLHLPGPSTPRGVSTSGRHAITAVAPDPSLRPRVRFEIGG